MGKDKNKRHKPLAEDVMQPYVVSEPSKRRKERERKRRDSDDEVIGLYVRARLFPFPLAVVTYQPKVDPSLCTVWSGVADTTMSLSF